MCEHVGPVAPLSDWRIDNEDPIAFPGPHDRLLERLQGNILKGHGRDFTVKIVLRFSDTASAGEIRRELKRLTVKYVKSAAHQLVERADHRIYGLPGGLFANLFLTRTAYIKLGYESKIPSWFDDPPKDPDERPDINFRLGMKGAASVLIDAVDDPTEPLEIAYAHGHIDALLLLADDDEAYLLRRARQAVTRMHERRVAKVVAVEPGRILRNHQGQGIEHFGYVDGRSQPLFLASDFCDLDHGRIIPGVTKERISATATGDLRLWNPFANLSLVLLRDPGVDDPDAFGSYYVFRKLEQNVKEFMHAEASLAGALSLAGDPRAGAMAVGRFRDGTPLVLHDRSCPSLALSNDFRCDNLTLTKPSDLHVDRFGLRCPFQSHLRKVNPRHDETVAGDPLARRIVRRGITYGERPDLEPGSSRERPTKDVGLLFACFQRSITRQFAFIQFSWANSASFPVTQTRTINMPGSDPVIGQRAELTPQNWRSRYGEDPDWTPPANFTGVPYGTTHTTPLPFGGFVRFRGGEFFFTPSLPFLLRG